MHYKCIASFTLARLARDCKVVAIVACITDFRASPRVFIGPIIAYSSLMYIEHLALANFRLRARLSLFGLATVRCHLQLSAFIIPQPLHRH